MSIYTRDNLASSLSQQLEAALNRRQKFVENDAARRDANVKAINSLVKSIAYAQEDDLDDRKKKLMAERNAALKAQTEMLDQSMERSGEALNDRYRDFMLGGGLKTAISPSGPSNGPGIAYEQAMGMKGYVPYGFTMPDYSDAMTRRLAFSDIMNRGGGIY